MNVVKKMAACAVTVGAFLSFTSLSSHAAEPDACPARLAVSQTTADANPGWKPFNSDEKHPWVGVSFSEGTPDQKVTLAPSSEKKIKGGTRASWTLTPSATGYWVSCLYAQTGAVIAKKLPADATFCEVEYDGQFNPAIAKKWHCGAKAKK